jgi:acyl-coenzyme A synthetase/AMP-(fatty) acid ligase
MKDMGMTLNKAIQKNGSELKKCITRLLSGPQTPERTFVLPETTYAELYATAACIRTFFRDQVKENFVCLCAEDKTTVTAALLASLAGGPVLLIPYSFNANVLGELQRLIGYRHVIVDAPRELPDGTIPFQPRSDGPRWEAEENAAAREPEAEWLRLFTGGTTGAPKMWTKTVRNLMSESLSILENYQIGANDRLIATVSPNHIYGLLYAILVPLLAAGSVAAQTPSFPAEIETAISENDATILISVPAHYRALNGHAFIPGSLRLAFSSAGMLAAEDAVAFTEQTGVAIAEIYGSTETGGIASRVRAAGEKDFKPYPAIDVRVENELLLVRSDYLSPELPLQDGCFVVGDRVTTMPDGRFQLLGRSDGIVKVGGQRVDLEVVRQTLKKLAPVHDAVVMSLPVENSRENQIVAVVESSEEATELNRLLTDALEPYARPRSIKVVDKIPMTAAGKVDRKTIEILFLGG